MTEQVLKAAVSALDAKKASDIKVIKVDSLTSLADYFVICNGNSTTQIKAIADECEFRTEQVGTPVKHREGKEAGNWVLLDYGDLIVHVFAKDTRKFYNLERFWADGTELSVEDLLK